MIPIFFRWLLILLVFGIGACSPHQPPSKPGVTLVFTNESPYPIVKIFVFSDWTIPVSIEKKHQDLEMRTLIRPIMPQRTDTLVFKSFNVGHHSIRVEFLIGQDTIKNVHRISDQASNNMQRSGTRHYGLYYTARKKDEGYTYLKYILRKTE